MDLNRYIETGNKEKLGTLFLKKAVKHCINKEFGKAYEFITLGLDILSCDSSNNDIWIRDYKNLEHDIFNDLENNHFPYYEYYLVKSFILSQNNDERILYIALDAIENYLKFKNDEIGYFIKSKILLSLDKYSDAVEILDKLLTINSKTNVLFNMGKFYQNDEINSSIKYFYHSYIKNPSSSSCLIELRKEFIKFGLENLLDVEEPTNDLILLFFSDINNDDFKELYEEFWTKNYNIEDSLNYQIEKLPSTLTVFIEYFQKYKENYFNIIDSEIQDLQKRNDYYHYDDDEISCSMDGDYNGYDDDTINIAFEGDPENTWGYD